MILSSFSSPIPNDIPSAPSPRYPSNSSVTRRARSCNPISRSRRCDRSAKCFSNSNCKLCCRGCGSGIKYVFVSLRSISIIICSCSLWRSLSNRPASMACTLWMVRGKSVDLTFIRRGCKSSGAKRLYSSSKPTNSPRSRSPSLTICSRPSMVSCPNGPFPAAPCILFGTWPRVRSNDVPRAIPSNTLESGNVDCQNSTSFMGVMGVRSP